VPGHQKSKSDSEFLLHYRGLGLTSKQQISVSVTKAEAGTGIVFVVSDKTKREQISLPANASYVVNTLRNVVLGKESTRLCIVEHFLAAATLWGTEDLIVHVDGPEMPLGDGSANFWIELFKTSHLKRIVPQATKQLNEAIMVSKQDRALIALPDEKFSITYLMDWEHPLIGKRWQTWDASKDPADLTNARTFGMLKEHELLGLSNDVVSLTPEGFTQPLRFEDEPVRHKLLDLIGDLTLIGFNPMRLKARFISIKGGHELDVQLAKKLLEQIG
jgi:UDP-3-O-[3-hydroxymyristoyl] N-acetylglucosamine deacetylase